MFVEFFKNKKTLSLCKQNQINEYLFRMIFRNITKTLNMFVLLIYFVRKIFFKCLKTKYFENI